MFLNTIKENDLFDKLFINNLLENASELIVPKNIKKEIIEIIENKEEMENDEKTFLLPSEKKFPIINPKTKKPDCSLIYAARLRARQFMNEKPEYKEIYDKATKLFNSEKCSQTIDIKLEEHDKCYELLELMDILEI